MTIQNNLNEPKSGFFNQNQEIMNQNSVFDLRKDYERMNHQTNDFIDHGKIVTNINGTIDFEKETLIKIANWIYECFLQEYNIQNQKDQKILSFYDVFDFCYNYILNNYNEIYSIFGKSLNDEEKKLVCVFVMCFFYENYMKNIIYQMMSEKLEKNKKGNIILETCLKTGITPREILKIFFEVSPPSKRIERMIKKNKEYFKKKYGKDWERILYATAWKQYKKMKNKE